VIGSDGCKIVVCAKQREGWDATNDLPAPDVCPHWTSLQISGGGRFAIAYERATVFDLPAALVDVTAGVKTVKVTAAAFSNDDRWLAVGIKNRLKIFNVQAGLPGKLVLEREIHEEQEGIITFLEFDRDSRNLFCSAGSDEFFTPLLVKEGKFVVGETRNLPSRFQVWSIDPNSGALSKSLERTGLGLVCPGDFIVGRSGMYGLWRHRSGRLSEWRIVDSSTDAERNATVSQFAIEAMGIDDCQRVILADSENRILLKTSNAVEVFARHRTKWHPVTARNSDRWRNAEIIGFVRDENRVVVNLLSSLKQSGDLVQLDCSVRGMLDRAEQLSKKVDLSPDRR
jgi:hypothetical protein